MEYTKWYSLVRMVNTKWYSLMRITNLVQQVVDVMNTSVNPLKSSIDPAE